MKKTILLALILLSITLQSFAEDYYYVEFYRGFLDGSSQDYPHRRKEALSKAQYLPKVQKDKIHEIVVQGDLTYMSYTNSFRELWSLRYKDKWEPEVLIAVADTAKFYIRFCDTDIELGFSEDVGVLHHILQQLRESDGLKAKFAFRDLTSEIKKVKEEAFLAEHRKRSDALMKQNLEDLNESFRKALKQALMKSALNLKKNLWQNNKFVWNSEPLQSTQPTPQA